MQANTLTTKERIIDAAVMLFSQKGYDTVSMRDIAREVGIKAASIYNHFSSKRDILTGIYDFYHVVHQAAMPDLNKLLPMLETEPVYNVLAKLSYHFPPHLQDKMDRILLIGSQRLCLDKVSESFVKDHFLEPLFQLSRPVLSRAIELGIIEPIDVDSFSRVVIFYAFSAAELNRTVMKTTLEEWQGGLNLIYSLLKPASKKK
jgi:AcrR family transcriptional regulator